MARIKEFPEGHVLSSSLGDVPIDADGAESIIVVLRNDNRALLLNERYYAYNDTVTLYCLSDLVEADMRSRELSTAKYYLEVYLTQEDLEEDNEDDHCVLFVVYCDRYNLCQDVSNFLAENFLTTLQARRIPPTGTSSLSYYVEKGNLLEYTIDVAYRVAGQDGLLYDQTTSAKGRTATAGVIMQVPIAVELLKMNIASQYETSTNNIEIVAITATAGQRSATFHVDRALDDANSFLFRNCFNILEKVTFSSTQTAKTDVDRSTAIVNGRSQFYNQRTTKSYDVETAQLTSDEAAWIEQFFVSRQAYRLVDGRQVPILITSSTSEMQDGDEKLNIAKFTWRFEDNRPFLPTPTSSDTFSDTYNLVYS